MPFLCIHINKNNGNHIIIMKKTNTIVTIFSSFLLFLSSCNQSEDIFTSQDNSLSLTCFQTGWMESPSGQQSRAVIGSEGKGSFTDNDRIEIQIVSENKATTTQLTYSNGQWSPNLQRDKYNKGVLQLSGIFPLLPQSTDDATTRDISLSVEQNNKEKYNAADILFANTTVDANSTSATLQFQHALHRIIINLKGTVPDDLKIEVRSLTDGNISITDGKVSLKGNASSTYKWITPQQETANTYTAIILPQEAKAYRGDEGFIRLTSKGKSVTYPIDSQIENFAPGMQTTLNLTLKLAEEGGNADIEFSNQAYWVYGITSPPFPGKEHIPSYDVITESFPKGEWMRIAYEKLGLPNEVQYLTWTEGCGWYDCNKTFNYKGDGNMCWAASASNLIHWWLEQNKKYVEAYETKYGTTCPKGYQLMTADHQDHSEVFNFFKASYPNKGSWDTGGVNWFINGDKKNLIYSYNENFKGFFSKVFSTKDVIATETHNTSKENFNQWIKDAFRSHKAIGFTASGFAGSDAKLHSMTIWGAEFDAEGYVSFIYYCDNNISDNEPNHGVVKRFKIIYKEGIMPGAYITPLDYNDGTLPKAQSLITVLTLVDLRQDIWKKAFPDVK